nr:MAG TPA: D12 class N6 adenine-specific DNA methyltransferase [Caudoviricetes sp.]
MKYGLPYKGSKNKLAERIVSLLPKRTHLIDLFCGGCAVSHAALLRNKYEHIHINDINWMCPTLFIDALNGKYQNETRWISREDFFRLKDTDPYVAVVWSFGNNLRNYLYSKEIEPLKKAIHYAIFFRDYTLGKDLGYDLSFIEPINDIQRRYAAVKRYFSQFGHFQQQSFEGGVENNHQLQVEHVTRGRILEIAEHRGLRTTQHQPPVLRGKSHQPDWKQSRDLQTSVRTSISRMPQQGLWDSKKKSTGRTLQRRTSQLHCTDCNTESDNYPCQEIRGGDFQTLHQVCLIISKLRYQMTA